jgi:neutral ceramidase
MLKIGIAQANITPDHPLRVAGMLNPPVVNKVHYPLFSKAFVFDDGMQTAAIIVLDNLFLASALIPRFRRKVTAGTNIPPNQVMVTCTHTHRAPYTAAIMDEEIDFDYLDFLISQSRIALKNALQNRQAGSIHTAQAEAPGWTFNRRQMYHSDLYGVQVGTQGPQRHERYIGNEGPEDNQLSILRACAEDGTSLGGLVNYACHTTVMGGEDVFSADFAGPLTDFLSEHLGGIFGFIQGAAGNLWSIDTSKESDRLARDYVGPAHAEKMAAALGGIASGAAEQSASDITGPVRIARTVLNIPQRKASRETVKLAQWYLEQAPKDIDQQEFTRKMYGHDYTFYHNSPDVQEWFAREAIGLWEWQRRVGDPQPSEKVEVQVVSVGQAAFVGLPGEIFTEFGLDIKTRSPFPFTFIAELANGWHGYIPTRQAFEHGGYEPRLGLTSRLVPEAGERMADAAVNLLRKLSA